MNLPCLALITLQYRYTEVLSLIAATMEKTSSGVCYNNIICKGICTMIVQALMLKRLH